MPSSVSGAGFPRCSSALLEQLAQRCVVETLQHHHLRTRQQRAVELEAGVLGGRANQRDDATLHEWQEAVLLGAVEAMDLVDEQKRALACRSPAFGLLECGAEVLHARENRRELLEIEVGALGEQAGDGRLACPRRPPEDQAGEPALRQHAADRAFGTEQVILADHVLDALRTQAVGERTGRFVGQSGGLEQVAHTPDLARRAVGIHPSDAAAEFRLDALAIALGGEAPGGGRRGFGALQGGVEIALGADRRAVDLADDVARLEAHIAGDRPPGNAVNQHAAAECVDADFLASAGVNSTTTAPANGLAPCTCTSSCWGARRRRRGARRPVAACRCGGSRGSRSRPRPWSRR